LVFQRYTASEQRSLLVGTDWVSLFNKRLCSEVLSLTVTSMPAFVEAHLGKLDERSNFRCRFDEDVGASNRIQQLQAEGLSEEDLKADLAEYLCVSNEHILLDYWACYAEVFVTDPPGSIPDYKLFPNLQEQRFLLLLPEHLDRMLSSLNEHKGQLTVMSEENIAKLRGWRDLSAQDPDHAIAYFFDY
jgi:hypothetical protein